MIRTAHVALMVAVMLVAGYQYTTNAAELPPTAPGTAMGPLPMGPLPMNAKPSGQEAGGQAKAGHHHGEAAPQPAGADAGTGAGTGTVRPSTAAMAKRLVEIADALSFDESPWNSLGRLAILEASPIPADREQQLQRMQALGIEQLNAGRAEEAAATLAALQRELRNKQSLTDSQALRFVTSMVAISWLRYGEVQNCALNHNADSCLLPIQGGGIHTDKSGADKAIVELEALMRSDPNDLTDRWVLNIAHMARGTWPDGVRPEWRIPPEAFASEEPFDRFYDVAPALGLDVADQAGGVIIDDFTGDGNLDVIVSAIGMADQLRFFVSRGDGTFEERTGASGLTGLVGGLNMVQADYDGDGWLDFLVLRGGWTQPRQPFPNSLVRNRGDGTFEDVTEAAGMLAYHPTQTATWGDYDNDGDVDLFVGNETASNHPTKHPNLLYRNDGDGTFTEVGDAAGVSTPGFTKSAVWGDYDNDGRLDLYLSRLAQPNLLYHNDGPGADGQWRFSEVGGAAGVDQPLYSFPSWWFDYDNDGWLDLFVSGYGDPDTDPNSSAAANVAADYLGLPTNAARLHLYRNNRDGTFEDVSDQAGISKVVFTMGCNFGDLDNDGFEDFYLGTGNPDFRSLDPSRMFRNVGDGTFHDVTTAGGFGNLQKGHGVSFTDIDNDGDQDVYADFGGAYDGDWYPNVLYENPGHGNHWATLRLTGPGHNTRAIGARVAIRLATPSGARTLHRVVGSGGSFGANSMQVEVGLGDATAIDSVSITWPGAAQPEVFTGLGMDAMWQITAGSGTVEPVTQPAFKLGGIAAAAR